MQAQSKITTTSCTALQHNVVAPSPRHISPNDGAAESVSGFSGRPCAGAHLEKVPGAALW